MRHVNWINFFMEAVAKVCLAESGSGVTLRLSISLS